MMMQNQNNTLAGSIGCAFTTAEDAKMVFNILVNRGYVPGEIHVLASSESVAATNAEHQEFLGVFEGIEPLSDGTMRSASMKEMQTEVCQKVFDLLLALGISETTAGNYESSLAENKFLVIVNPHDEEERREINEEFNFYRGKQIHGNEEYTE
jgi:hypothetical protein